MFPGAPVFRQEEFIVGIDYLGDSLFQALLCNMTQIQPGYLFSTQPLHGSCGLGGSKVAAVTKECSYKAFARFVYLGFKPR